jgi:hypothetical protein
VPFLSAGNSPPEEVLRVVMPLIQRTLPKDVDAATLPAARALGTARRAGNVLLDDGLRHSFPLAFPVGAGGGGGGGGGLPLEPPPAALLVCVSKARLRREQSLTSKKWGNVEVGEVILTFIILKNDDCTKTGSGQT